MEATHKDKLIRVQGDIFNHVLQDILRLDGLFIAVKKGFSIIHSRWMKYRENPNPRLDARRVFMCITTATNGYRCHQRPMFLFQGH